MVFFLLCNNWCNGLYKKIRLGQLKYGFFQFIVLKIKAKPHFTQFKYALLN